MRPRKQGEAAHTGGKVSCLSFQNQDLEEGEAEEKMLVACFAKMLSPSLSLQSWPNRENILRCSWAWKGRQPANRNTTGAGVAWWSLRSLWMCTL